MMHGFELLRDQPIPELNTQAHLWRHIKTGAELLSLQNDDHRDGSLADKAAANWLRLVIPSFW